jgi:prophage regulatory protein
VFQHRRGHRLVDRQGIRCLVTCQAYGRPVPSRPSIELAGVAEIAELLGVSRQRVDQLVREHDDFPRPIAELAAGRIWIRQEIVDWAERKGRLRA